VGFNREEAVALADEVFEVLADAVEPLGLFVGGGLEVPAFAEVF